MPITRRIGFTTPSTRWGTVFCAAESLSTVPSLKRCAV